MATTYATLYDLFTVRIRDYEMDDLYTASPTNWKLYLKGFLLTAIPRFGECIQDLTDRNDTTGTFNITLTEPEQNILISLMEIAWLSKNIEDIRQINVGLNESDFRKDNIGTTIRVKMTILISLKEDTDREISQYDWRNTDILSWSEGDYSGSL